MSKTRTPTIQEAEEAATRLGLDTFDLAICLRRFAAHELFEASMPSAAERDALIRALNDFGTSERLAALDTLRALIEKGERDTSLLDGRDHDPARYEEAYRLLDLLRAREEREVGR